MSKFKDVRDNFISIIGIVLSAVLLLWITAFYFRTYFAPLGWLYDLIFN